VGRPIDLEGALLNRLTGEFDIYGVEQQQVDWMGLRAYGQHVRETFGRVFQLLPSALVRRLSTGNGVSSKFAVF
jgi:hypothetical protein